MTEESPAAITRRRFLTRAVAGMGAIIGTALAVPLIGYFLSPLWKRPETRVTPIGRVSDIPVGEPVFLTFEQRIRDGWMTTTVSRGAWVVRRNSADLVIFDPRCTHLKCPYYWDEARQLFQCPCHDGRFDIDGNVLAGPPPRPLDRLPFTVEDDSIQLVALTELEDGHGPGCRLA